MTNCSTQKDARDAALAATMAAYAEEDSAKDDLVAATALQEQANAQLEAANTALATANALIPETEAMATAAHADYRRADEALLACLRDPDTDDNEDAAMRLLSTDMLRRRR